MSKLQQPTQNGAVTTAVIFEGALVFVAIVLGWLVGQAPLPKVAWNVAGFGVGLAATGPLVVGLVLIDCFPIGPLKRLEELMQQTVLPLFRGATWFDLCLVSLLAGAGEEMLFRGVLQDLAQKLTGSANVAVVLTSVFFGLAHPLSRTYVALATLIGLYLGGIYLATGNLLVPIVCHATYDFVALNYLLREPIDKLEMTYDEWLV